MATRAIYRFKDEDETLQVYKHWDGYPKGANIAIKKTLEFAWDLPRFEADEFAASFVAANKSKEGGDIRLNNWIDPYKTDLPNPNEIGAWIEYLYEIYMKDSILHIKASSNYGTLEVIYDGPFVDFEDFTEKETEDMD
jgi:hypothetical protein